MSFISYFSLPMNMIILLYCRFPSVAVGATQSIAEIAPEEQGVLVQYLVKKDPLFWDRSTIILLVILIEHLVIGIKILIALIIPDVPFKVQQDEVRREKIIEKATEEMIYHKVKNKQKSFKEMVSDLQKKATDEFTALVKQDNELDEAEGDMSEAAI